MSNSLRLSRIATIFVSLIVIAAFFLPFINATEDYAEYLKLHENEKVFETADITVGEMESMSLYTYAKVYFQAGEEIYGEQAAGIVYLVLIGGIGALGLISCLWALAKKPILLLLNSLLIGGAFYLTIWDFTDRGIMPDSNRVWGISYYMIYPCVVLLIICAIWMFVEKRRAKKGNRKRREA